MKFKIGDKIEARLLHNDLNPELQPDVENFTVEEVKDGKITTVSRMHPLGKMMDYIGTHKMLDRVKLIEPEIAPVTSLAQYSFTDLNSIRNMAYIKKDKELYQAVDSEINSRYDKIKNLCTK